MSIEMVNVGIAVQDLEEAISFFTDLGLTVVGRDTVRGEWTDTAVGLDGNHARIAMLRTPDGLGHLELFEYIQPAAIATQPTRPNEIGMHRVAFKVDDVRGVVDRIREAGWETVGEIVDFQSTFLLCYVRGPEGLIVELAERLDGAPG